MSTPPIPSDINDALALYFDNQATPEVCKTIQAWLEQDPANANIFAEFGYIERMIYCAQKSEDASAIFAMLAEMEAEADAEIVELKLDPSETSGQDFASLSVQDFTAAGRYVLSHALSKKSAMITSIVMAAAAVLLLALILINPFASDTPAPIADIDIDFWDEPDPSDPSAPLPRTFATLTDSHDARWDAPAGTSTPTPGDALRVGERLTLTSGFAEITTARRAVVILEAPATIELTHNDNAIQLLAGKLVGICETSDSKGFTVYTPKARVVDLGTRFGVEVHSDGSTTAAVFDGEVELSEISDTPSQPKRNVRLTAGWASNVSHEGVLSREPRSVTNKDLSQFAKSIDETAQPGYAYRRAVLASMPLMYWGFDEGGSTTKNLAGDVAFDGKAIGQIASGEGLIGSALQLGGTIETVGGFACSEPMQFDGRSEYTIEAWCWIDRPHHGRLMTLATFDKAAGRFGESLGLIEFLDGQDMPPTLRDFAPATRFMHHTPSSVNFALEEQSIFAKAVAPKQWVHVAAVRTATQATLYLNGQSVSVASDLPKAGLLDLAGLFVGVAVAQFDSVERDAHELRPFAGRIDEVAVYGAALSAETLQNHYQLGLPQDAGQALP